MQLLSTLFAKKENVNQATSSQPDITFKISSTSNPDNIQPGETYTNYGKRICMKTAGEPMSLAAVLQHIYASKKQEMIDNKALQEAHKASTQNAANQVDLKITTLKSANAVLDGKIGTSSDKISELESEISVLQASNGEENKQAVVKFWIGCFILLILTVYLFIFYSSTFYSAFIHTPEDVSSAMFDPQAIPNAFSHGIMSGLFLCTVPIIFLGLGFGLHYISEQQGIGKYIKSGALVLVTLMFDCILAVAIAKGLYQVWASNIWGSAPPFTLSMAASDLNVWAVIFCGFIVYMIWAVVFDLTMTAYGDIHSNKSVIIKLKQQIEQERKNVDDTKNEILKNEGEIQQLIVQKNNILSQMTLIPINTNVIFNVFSQFYQGWMTTLNAVGLGADKENDCKLSYARECKNLLGIDINHVSSSATPILTAI